MNKIEQYYINDLKRYYAEHKEQMNTKIKPIIEGKSKLSLRFIENFVLQFSNKNRVAYIKQDGSLFIVHNSYKAQLSSFNKEYFDSFRRTKRIRFEYGREYNMKNKLNSNSIVITKDGVPMNFTDINSDTEVVIGIHDNNYVLKKYGNCLDTDIILISLNVETTIAQLNYCRWLLSNELLDHIEKNYDKIKGIQQQHNSK